MAMGLAAFAPCILLPEWREYQALQVAEQREHHRLDQLRSTLARERETIEAIQTDPAVVARLARRDLRYHRPNEIPVSIELAARPNVSESPFVPQPVNPPAWMARGEELLPRLNYDGVFCDRETRFLVLGLSMAILTLSMALSPKPDTRHSL